MTNAERAEKLFEAARLTLEVLESFDPESTAAYEYKVKILGPSGTALGIAAHLLRGESEDGVTVEVPDFIAEILGRADRETAGV